MDYLAITDELLLHGIARTSKGFLRHQMNWLEAQRKDDGGFGGRRGGSDLYYTDFGARCLTLLGADSEYYGCVADYLSKHTFTPVTVVEWFNLLNIRRIVTRYGNIPSVSVSHPGLLNINNTYDLFLNALCMSMTGEKFNPCVTAHYAVEDIPQTNLLAAWIGYLLIVGKNDMNTMEEGLSTIAAFRHSDGGYLAHANAPGSDLLSTYSAFLTLSITNHIHREELAGLTRFVKSCASPDGGFAASPDEPETDVEYTYYGLGLIGLIRSMSDSLMSGSGVS